MANLPTSQAWTASFVFGGPNLPTGAVSSLSYQSLTVADDAAEVFKDFWEDLRMAMSNQLTLLEVSIKQGPSASGPTKVYAVNSAGTSGQAAASPNTAWLWHLPVDGFSGRYAGRMYWPTPQEEAVEPGGTVASAYRVSVQGKLNTFYAAMLAEGIMPTVYPAGVGDPKAVTGIVADSKVATQRRRLRR